LDDNGGFDRKQRPADGAQRAGHRHGDGQQRVNQRRRHRQRVAAGEFSVCAADPLMPGKVSLYVYGSTSSDAILVGPGSSSGAMSVAINGKTLPAFTPQAAFVIHGEAGSTYIGVSSLVTNAGLAVR